MPTTEPTWDIAKLFPDQGYWDEDDYLHLPGRRLIEFADGSIEVLEMPSERHQRLRSAKKSWSRAYCTLQSQAALG
jgi:hypothetical protein